jgi:hypothetical protein
VPEICNGKSFLRILCAVERDITNETLRLVNEVSHLLNNNLFGSKRINLIGSGIVTIDSSDGVEEVIFE